MKKRSTSNVLLPGAGPAAKNDQAHDPMLQHIFHPNPELDAQIRDSAPEVRQYVLQLHAVIADLEVQKMAAQHGIVPHSPKRAKKRGSHGVDMAELRKLIFGNIPATAGPPPEPPAAQ